MILTGDAADIRMLIDLTGATYSSHAPVRDQPSPWWSVAGALARGAL